MKMDYKEKMKACSDFIQQLANILSETHELVGSCNRDASLYLIPKGTLSELSYYGKPDKSFRFSDHWNWYSNIRKCQNEHMVQCRSLDMPWARKRETPGMATKPRFGIQVCLYDMADKCYHFVYGDRFDRKTKAWTWIENDPSDIAAKVIG